MRASTDTAARIATAIGAALCMLPGISAAQQSALRPASPQAEGIAALWWAMFYGGLAIFLAVMILLAWSQWSVLRGSKPLSAIASRNLVIVAGVVIPLLILLVLVGGSLFLGRSIASEPPADAVTVRVTGWMWWWEIDYLDSEGEVIATTANELHVPVGRPVSLQLASGDVIHSFWLPELQGKTDLVPGKTNSSWFTANRPGVFRGQCAEFCGVQHALMAFIAVAQPPEDFEAWLENQAADASVPEDEAARRGMDVFQTASCAGCHTIRGSPARGELGPDLTHLASRRTLAAATRPNTRGHLAGWISDPQSVKPGNRMPRSLLSPQELNDLVAYLETLD